MEPFTFACHGRFALAWSDVWPGLIRGGATEEEVSGGLTLAVAECNHWLSSHGENEAAASLKKVA